MRTLQSFRVSIEDRLGKKLPDDLWQNQNIQWEATSYLEADDEVEADSCLKAACNFAEGFMDKSRHAKGRATAKPVVMQEELLPRGFLSPYEEARANAQGVELAYLAGTEPFVRKFWKGILGYIPKESWRSQQGHLLTPVEAEAFVTSPVLRAFPKWFCEMKGISLVGHTVGSVEETAVAVAGGHIRNNVVIEVEGKKYKQQWTSKAHGKPLMVAYDADQVEDNRTIRVQHVIWERSVIDDLRKVADRLMAWYGWEQAPTLRFILTGEPPQVVPIWATTKQHVAGIDEPSLDEITLVVKPWVSEESVIQMYREGQRRLLKNRKTKANPRYFRVFCFVMQQTDSSGHHPHWPQMMEEWNKTCIPADRYDTYRHFFRDYGRAKDALWV